MNHIFATKFVYWTKIKNHKNIKKAILPDLLEDLEDNGDSYRERNHWKCSVTSSFYRDQPLEFLDQSFYSDIVWTPMKEMYREMAPIGIEPFSKLALNEFWYNHYTPGQYQETHNHANGGNRSLFSGVYLFDVRNSDCNTIFYDENGIAAYNMGIQQQFRTDKIQEGHVLIFPSELSHSVAPAINARITFSFNVFPA